MSVGDEVVNFLNSSPMSLNSMLHVWPRKLLCMLPGLPFIKTSMEMDCSGVVESMVCMHIGIRCHSLQIVLEVGHRFLSLAMACFKSCLRKMNVITFVRCWP